MTNPSVQSSKPASMLSDRTYNFLRQSATIILPAVGALYVALALLWHLPKAEEVTGTVAALNVFVGVVVSLAQRWYNATGAKYDGSIDVKYDEDGAKKFLLNLDTDPDNIDTKSEITFKINSP